MSVLCFIWKNCLYRLWTVSDCSVLVRNKHQAMSWVTTTTTTTGAPGTGHDDVTIIIKITCNAHLPLWMENREPVTRVLSQSQPPVFTQSTTTNAIWLSSSYRNYNAISCFKMMMMSSLELAASYFYDHNRVLLYLLWKQHKADSLLTCYCTDRTRRRLYA